MSATTPVLTPTESDVGDPTQPVEDEFYASWSLLILTGLLIGTLWTSYYLQLKKIRVIHETVVAIVGGMIAGIIIRSSPSTIIQKMVTFNDSFFFNLLLPPIILNSGYELKKNNFFRNFGTILTFAFLGTFISAIVTGTLVYLFALSGIEDMTLTLHDSMIFGSILSATDPVTILAIFSQLKVDPKLYAIIFGESMLNDAVAIVLSGTLYQFRGQNPDLANIFRGVTTFLGTFFVSMFIGILFAIFVALSLKYSSLHRYPWIESCIVSLMAYNSYLFSNACEMSGIVSLLFCGITLKHYAYDNMSLRTKRTTKYMFHVLAQLSENFVFVYLGVTLFTQSDLIYKPLFIITTTVAICIARYFAVFPLSTGLNLVNRARKRPDRISRSHQIMIFWAGLRGAVAFALVSSLPPVMRTTVLVVVVLTVIIFGGTTNVMLGILGIRTGVEEENDNGDESDEDYFNDEEEQLETGFGRGEVYLHSREGSVASMNSEEQNENVQLSSQHNIAPSPAPPSLFLSAPTTLTGIPSLPTEERKHWLLSFDDWIKPALTRPVRQGSRYRPIAQRVIGRENETTTPNERLDIGEEDAVALGGLEMLPEGVPDKARRVLDGSDLRRGERELNNEEGSRRLEGGLMDGDLDDSQHE